MGRDEPNGGSRHSALGNSICVQRALGMLRQRVISGDTVVAYGHIGYRSSATFLVARLLRYSVMLYDGSFEDWTSRHGPTEKDPTPLLDP